MVNINFGLKEDDNLYTSLVCSFVPYIDNISTDDIDSIFKAVAFSKVTDFIKDQIISSIEINTNDRNVVILKTTLGRDKEILFDSIRQLAQLMISSYSTTFDILAMVYTTDEVDEIVDINTMLFKNCTMAGTLKNHIEDKIEIGIEIFFESQESNVETDSVLLGIINTDI